MRWGLGKREGCVENQKKWGISGILSIVFVVFIPPSSPPDCESLGNFLHGHFGVGEV